MRFLIEYLKNYSLVKGKTFSFIGVLVIAGSLITMFKGVIGVTEGIELLIIGLVLAGLSNEQLKKIRGNTDNEPKP